MVVRGETQFLRLQGGNNSLAVTGGRMHSYLPMAEEPERFYMPADEYEYIYLLLMSRVVPPLPSQPWQVDRIWEVGIFDSRLAACTVFLPCGPIQ